MYSSEIFLEMLTNISEVSIKELNIIVSIIFKIMQSIFKKSKSVIFILFYFWHSLTDTG